MAGIHDTRRTNARTLAREAGGIRRLAERIGRAENSVSAMIGAGERRNIGEKIAREIERAFGKPPGWLDRDHAAAQYTQAARDIAENFNKLPPERQQQLEGIIAAAIGYAVPDQSVARYLPAAPKNETEDNGS